MPEKRVRLLNFDDSLVAQKRLIQRFAPLIVDCKAYATRARIWLNQTDAQALTKILAPSQDTITLFGSGDYHHISGLLVKQFQDPFSLIVFDHHPDWDIMPPKIACGAWVSRALEHPAIQRIILIGIFSEDISSASIYTANLKSLANNRLTIYPYQHRPTRVFFKAVPENDSIVLKRSLAYTEIHWKQLGETSWEDFWINLIQKIPTDKVYISIDKDCLRKEFALTNWEEGMLSLDQIIMALKILKQHKAILAADITGEFSLPVLSQSPLKQMISAFDHPKNFSAAGFPADRIHRVNENTNIRLLETLRDPQ